MKRPKKGKLPAKPSFKKHPSKPKLPKGGIKTEAQLNSYRAKKDEWKKKCKAVDSENNEKLKKYNAVLKKIEDAYKKDLKAYDNFRKDVEKVKNS